MPRRADRPCAVVGCPGIQIPHSRFCPDHQDREKEAKKQAEGNRGSSPARGYDKRWGKYAKSFLLRHPLCEECLKTGRTTRATQVDHIRAHHGDRVLFWDKTNHQALCAHCHSRKTAREDGAFGNPLRLEVKNEEEKP